MSALDNYSPQAVGIVKMFTYAFRSAPTADLVTWGVNALNAGQTPAQLLGFIFNYPVPQSPFTAYATGTTDAAFCTALVDNFCDGADISSATKAGWVAYLTPLVPAQPSRADFAIWVAGLVETYGGDMAELLALKASLAARAEKAAAFAQSPAGAVWDGQGFAQLMAPLAPLPQPTYDLAAGVASVDEGGSVTFTLHTTHVAAGTTIGYTLSGTGITAADVAGAALTGTMTVDAAGVATATVVLSGDALTEGAETLRMTLADGLAHADVVVNDTSTTPPPPPTYALSANVQAQDEGGSVVYTLTTTNLASGTVVPFTLSGTGITAADITGGALTGMFLVNAQGTGSATIVLAADATTEGAETLRLRLDGVGTSIDITVNDTSVTPAPVGTPDLLEIANVMNNTNAHAPATPAEGEITINTWLTQDLLNQSGATVQRMSLAALRATNAVAGAPLDPTNHSADRGNIPQVSNQSLFTFDLGLETDRVDYSAETGKIAAIVSTEAPADTLWVMVNDNGVDDNFAGATDRIDTLKNVEEIVASAGGGVLDLTNSARDWQVTFSRTFNAATDVDPVRDRAVHRVELFDLGAGSSYGRTFLEYRDAGEDPSINQATAAWTTVQGGDHNETLIFNSAQSTDARLNVLRGGANAVKFNELTHSILVDVAITPWVASTLAADDTNATGLITATTTFTIGDGVTPLSSNTNVSTSYTPDNGIAAGRLRLAATQDSTDAISFAGTALPKLITLGYSVAGGTGAAVRLVSGPADNALELTGFEKLRDSDATDDLYVIDDIALAVQGSPRLLDGALNDHDTVRLHDEALGSGAVGGAAGTVNLATLNGALPGFTFDFDALDLSAITASGLQVLGTGGTDDELVVGKLATLAAVSGFEALVLTDASLDKGAVLTLNLDSGVVKAGATTLFSYGGSALSAGGLVFGNPAQDSVVAPVASSFNLAIVDSTAGAGGTLWGGGVGDVLTGGAGDDTLRGGGGDDTLDGGVPAGAGDFTETWGFTISGTPDAVAAAANRITITMTIDGTVLTLTEAAAADTAYGDGNGAVVDGASTATIGQAMAALVNANLAAINAGAGTGTLASASFDSTSGTVLLSFLAGTNANDAVSFVLNGGAGPDAGTFTLSAGVNANGGDGGADRFVFEATGVLNGRDSLVNFTRASDKLDVTAFTGAAISAAGAPINAATGGILAGVATTAEFVYNKALGALSVSDFATSVAAGKLVLADGGRCVVAVTADLTGARGDAVNTAVSLYYVENGAVAGLSDLSVSLVGTVAGPAELTLADIYWALG